MPNAASYGHLAVSIALLGVVLKVCYIDESGGFEAQGSTPDATPLMVLLGLIVDHEQLRTLTRRFLEHRQRFYRSSLPPGRPILDVLLEELKGSTIRRNLRSSKRNDRRQAIRFLDGILDLLIASDARLIGRVWIKCLELSLVLSLIENLERDDLRDGQLAALKRTVPVGSDQRVVGVVPDRRVEQVDPASRQAHGSTRSLPQASSFNLALSSGLSPLGFELRSRSAWIASRRALPLIGPVPFDAERALARVTGSAAVVVRFFVVAMGSGYQGPWPAWESRRPPQASVVRSSATPQLRRGELGCCCRLPPGWDLLRFAGGAFACLERPPPWRGRGLFPSRPARCPAVPGLEMAPYRSRSRGRSPGRPCTGELDIDGRSARPWYFTPSPAPFAPALSKSGACDHMTVS